MSEFTTNMTGVAQVDDSLITKYSEAIILASQETAIIDPLCDVKEEARAQTISFTKYTSLTPATTALTALTDVDGEAMADSAVTLSPVQYGNAIVLDEVADIGSDGKVSKAAIQLLGYNLAQTKDQLGIQALEGSTNILTPSDKAVGSITESDTLTRELMSRAYNKLRRTPVNVHPLTKTFVAIVHPDVAEDYKQSPTWVDVAKYANAAALLNGEIGMDNGFRFLVSSNVTIGTNLGANSTVDIYKTICFGFNALGLAVAQQPRAVMQKLGDKLARFTSLGWKGIFKYGIINTDSVWVIKTASSFGSNLS
jgi:N4-gp56 family major capsid protein